MLVRSTEQVLLDRRGRKVSILQPLIETGHRPNGGWISAITVNGSKMVLGGSTPKAVLESLRTLMVNNRIEFTENHLWTTLNMDWLSRTQEPGHKVPIRDFLSQCETPEGQPEFRGKIDRESWLPSALDTIGFYLAIDNENYRYVDLATLASTVVRMADPTTGHRLGDHEVFASLLELYSIISYTPCHLLEEARAWFIEMFNVLATIRKVTPITRATATLKYHWDNETKD